MEKHSIMMDLLKEPIFAKLSIPFISVDSKVSHSTNQRENDMPKRAKRIKRPKIMLDATWPVPLYKQLYERLRGTILAGQLERGAPFSPRGRAWFLCLSMSRDSWWRSGESCVPRRAWSRQLPRTSSLPE
jgi:hypothetical protein